MQVFLEVHPTLFSRAYIKWCIGLQPYDPILKRACCSVKINVPPAALWQKQQKLHFENTKSSHAGRKAGAVLLVVIVRPAGESKGGGVLPFSSKWENPLLNAHHKAMFSKMVDWDEQSMHLNLVYLFSVIEQLPDFSKCELGQCNQNNWGQL